MSPSRRGCFGLKGRLRPRFFTATAGRGGVAFQVRDVVDTHRRLVEAGVTSVFPHRRTVIGILARLRDPDGNPIEIVQALPRPEPA